MYPCSAQCSTDHLSPLFQKVFNGEVAKGYACSKTKHVFSIVIVIFNNQKVFDGEVAKGYACSKTKTCILNCVVASDF